MSIGQKKIFIFFSLYLLIIVNTLNVFINNFEFHFTKNVVGVSIILFIALLSLSYIFLFLLKRITQNSFFYFFLILFFFLCLISTINPNINSPGENLKTIVFINLGISLLLTLITIKFRIYNFFIIATFVTILVNTIYSTSALYKKYSNQNVKKIANNNLISKKLNIFIINFDNIPFHIIEEEFEKEKDKNYLNDFVFFNKFISTTQSTYGNIIFEVYGNKLNDYTKKTKTEYINKLKPNPNNLINFIKKNNISASFYGRYNSLEKKDELIDFTDLKLLELTALTFQRFIIPSLERLFTYKIRFFYNKHIGNKYLWENKQSLKQYEKYLKKIDESNYTDKIVINMGHWFFTQLPISLNKNCQFKENLPQNIANMKGVGECSMKLIKKFINVLKNKGIYENSIIVFKSDNGIHSNFYPKSNTLSRSNNNSIYGYSMYRPFLMVKSLNSKRWNNFNNSIISTADLASYYCEEIRKISFDKSNKNKCESMGSTDLYKALYLNNIKSDKKLNILFDNGTKSHLMDQSIFKTINIINGNVDEAFLTVFPD